MRIAPFSNSLFGRPKLLIFGGLTVLFGWASPLLGNDADPSFWWGAADLSAVPHYLLLDTPDGSGRDGSPPVFDASDRIWVGGETLTSYDGQRWIQWRRGNLDVKGLDSSNRLWLNRETALGYLPLDENGYPASLDPVWVNEDFPEDTAGLYPWETKSFPGEPGVFMVLGNEIWHWEKGHTKRLLSDKNSNFLLPSEWREHWFHGSGDGKIWLITAQGPELALELDKPGLIPRWIRDDPRQPGAIQIGGDNSVVWTNLGSQREYATPSFSELTGTDWYLGSSTAPSGWVFRASHLGKFLVYPADGWRPLVIPEPRLTTLSGAETTVGMHRFDSRENLWLGSLQGIFRWEHPGKTWRWVPDKVNFYSIKTTSTGLLLINRLGLDLVDFAASTRNRQGYDDSLFFDALQLTPERIAGASRRQILLYDGDHQQTVQVEDGDLLILKPLGSDPEHFLAFGEKSLYLGTFPAEGEPTAVPLLEQPNRILSVAADGLSFDGLFADGSILRWEFIRDDVKGFRLGKVEERSPRRERTVSGDLLPWGPDRLVVINGRLSLLREHDTLLPMGEFEDVEVLKMAPMDDDQVLIAARARGEDTVLFARLDGPPDPHFVPEFRWYPGTLDIGSLTCLAWEPRHGHIFIGGTEKLLSFSESLLRPLTELPPVHLEMTAGTETAWQDSDHATVESLPFDASQLRFRWYGEEWQSRAPYRVETRVAGLSPAWTASPNAEREFSGMREGRYTLEARVLDPFGSVRQELAYGFRILPPWYRSSWAYGAYVFLLLAAIWASFRFYSFRQRIQREYLETVVRKRTAELEEANAAKAEFVANMSHELRNPINGVVGLTELLEHSGLEEEQSRLVKTLRACSEQLGRMIGDVLDFAKIEAGRLTLDKRAFHAPTMVERVIEVVSWDAEQSSHHIVHQSEGEAPYLVTGDDAKISQILINFLNNACKYGDPGRIILRSIYSPGMSNRLNLRFEVADGGPGMSEEERARVFERFYRAPKAANSPTRGSGLGLAVCAELAELMGAKIGVEANAEGGTTFSFEVALPLPEGVEQGRDVTDFDSTYMGTVLVVDDMDYNRMVAAGLLESLGFTVTSVASGDDAIACLVTADYDFAFLDYELPDMTGPDILRAVQREKVDFRTKCFAVTAYAAEDKRRECFAAGFMGFVSKPISRMRLREVLIGSGLNADDLATGAYQQPIVDTTHHAYDLEPLLVLAGGSMERLMDKCEEYLAILRQEVEDTLELVGHRRTEDIPALGKRLHRLTSHASIVKSRTFIEAVDALRWRVKNDGTETWPKAADQVLEKSRELAINLRRVVDEYRSPE